jgi:hypothetical protein
MAVNGGSTSLEHGAEAPLFVYINDNIVLTLPFLKHEFNDMKIKIHWKLREPIFNYKTMKVVGWKSEWEL